MIMHRLRYLLIYKCNLPDKSVDILLGPFVNWEIGHKDYKPSASVVANARSIAETSVQTTYYLLILRMCCVWEIYTKYTDSVDPAYTFPYYIGVVMDIHTPGIGLGSLVTLHGLYTQDKAPELIQIDHIVNDSSSQIDPIVVERHWVSYSCHVDPPPKRKKTAGKSTKPTRGRKRNTIKHSINTLIDVTKASDVQETPTRQDMKLLKEMLTKGQPNQTVYRYVQKAFTKGLIKSPETNPIIITMARMFLMGVYRHAKVIADPAFRLRVLWADPAELYAIINESEYNAKQLYYILAEFTLAATRHNHALVSMLKKTAGHNEYETNAIYNGDHMRTVHHTAYVELSKPPRTPVVPRIPSNIRLFWELVRHLVIKHKPSPKKVGIAIKGIGYTHLYNVFRRQPNTLRIYMDLLQAVEIPKGDLDLIETTLTTGSNDQISKSLKRMVALLSEVGRCRLYMYVHYITRRAMLNYIPIGYKKTFNPGVKPRLIVCENCFTIRTPCLMSNSTTKAKSEGVELDLVDYQLRCSQCRSDNLRSIDMRYYYVYGPSMSEPTRSRTYCACSRCGIITTYKLVVGKSEFCQPCYKDEMASYLVARKCICGGRLDEKTRHVVVNAINSRGEVGIYGLCTSHRHIQSQCRSGDIPPISFFRTLIRLGDRKRKR